MTIKKNEKYIPTKNYVVALIIILVVIFGTLYAFEWYKIAKENKVQTSYLTKNNVIQPEMKSIEEVKSVFSEMPDNYFVYISYNGEEDIYNMEKDLKDVIVEYKLNDIFYFINVTDMKNNDNYKDELNETLNLKDQKIDKIPTILYFKNGNIAKNGIVKSDNDYLSVDDFRQFLDEIEYKN